MNQRTFERLHPDIQAYIYKNRWEKLRLIQVKAIEAILDSEEHVLLASPTASGKTEAAIKQYEDFLENFPFSLLAGKVRERLRGLKESLR